MTAPPPARSAVRPFDSPFVLALGAVGVFIALRVAWAGRGGAPALILPPLLVGALVVIGSARVLHDLYSARSLAARLRGFDGNEIACDDGLVHEAKDLIDRASSTLPSICILVGLLGTFAGLFEALVGARDLLGSAVDAAALRAIVAAPLSGLARAFGSSAAGIVGSIVLGASEGRFQRVADGLAVSLESFDDKRRTHALGQQLAGALDGANGKSRADAERSDARLEALLERVACASEAQLKDRAAFASAMASLTAAAEARALAADDHMRREAESWRAGLAGIEGAVSALGPALTSAVTSSVQHGASALAVTSEEMLAVYTDERKTSLARHEEHQAKESAHFASACAALEGVAAKTDRVLHAMDVTGTSHREATEVALREVLRASRAEVELLLRGAGEHLAQVVGAAGEQGRAMAAQAQAREELNSERIVSELRASLAAWEGRELAFSGREEEARKARWLDDDAARSEWAGAEKMVLQAAMDMVAERIAVAADVQARSGTLLEGVATALGALERAQTAAAVRHEEQFANAAKTMTEASATGADALAEALRREALALVEACRGEVARGVRSLDDAGRELSAHLVQTHGATSDTVTSMGEQSKALGAAAGDVARSVEILADLLRIMPIGVAALPAAPADRAASSMAPAGALSDEDRAAFVACLEEARRWFDASQALQQQLLDDLAHLRRGHTQP